MDRKYTIRIILTPILFALAIILGIIVADIISRPIAIIYFISIRVLTNLPIS
jgi:hypothetical protein